MDRQNQDIKLIRRLSLANDRKTENIDSDYLVIHEESDEEKLMLKSLPTISQHASGGDDDGLQLVNQNALNSASDDDEQNEPDTVLSETESDISDDDDEDLAQSSRRLAAATAAGAALPATARKSKGLSTSEALNRLVRNIRRGLDAYSAKNNKLQWFWHAFQPQSVHAVFTWTGFAIILLELIIVCFALVTGDFNLLMPESEVIVLCVFLAFFLVLNVSLNAWHAYTRHFEMFKKAKLLEKRIDSARKLGRWPLVFYESLDTPDSPCISLQWTYRDNVLVNLPSCMLVEGDVVLLKPAQQVYARCQQLNDDGSIDSSCLVLNQHDIYLPKPSEPPTNAAGAAVSAVARAVDLVVAKEFRVLHAPINNMLQHALDVQQSSSPRPRSVFENERNRAWQLVEKIVLPAAVALNLLAALVRHYTHESEQYAHESFVEQFVLSFVIVVLPLTPLMFPIFYVMANYVGLARVLSLLSRFRRKKHKIERLAESRVTDTYFFAEVHWPTLWRKFRALIKGDDESLHRTANFMQTLANVSAVCCVDKKGLLSWANPNAEKVFFIRSHRRSEANHSTVLDLISAQLAAKLDYNAVRQRVWNVRSGGGGGGSLRHTSLTGAASDTKLLSLGRNINSGTGAVRPFAHANSKSRGGKQPYNKFFMSAAAEPPMPRGIGTVLELPQSGNEPFAMHFNGSSWRRHLESLKPLGLAILLNTCVEYHSTINTPASMQFYRMFADHLAFVANITCPLVAVPVLNRRCLCMLAQNIGFLTVDFQSHFQLMYRFGIYRKPAPSSEENAAEGNNTNNNSSTNVTMQYGRKMRENLKSTNSSRLKAEFNNTEDIELGVHRSSLRRVSVNSDNKTTDAADSPFHSAVANFSPLKSLRPSATATTVVNEVNEIDTAQQQMPLSMRKRRESGQGDGLTSTGGRTSSVAADADDVDNFHSCRTSPKSSVAALNDDDDEDNDDAHSLDSNASQFNIPPVVSSASSQVYKTPFPNCYVTVVQDRLSGLCHVIVQGTGDMLADLVKYYWNGTHMKPITDADRIRVREFYTRHSLTAFAAAFGYKTLPNFTELANLIKTRKQQQQPNNTSSTPLFNDKGDFVFELPIIAPRSSSSSGSSSSSSSASSSSSSTRSASSSVSYLEQIVRNTRLAGDNFSADILQACLSELVFIGAAMFQYQSRNSFVHTIELLQQGCIRFIHFSRENELRARAFAERLGLESGWNCHVCLDSEAIDPHAATTLLTGNEKQQQGKGGGGGVLLPAQVPASPTTATNTERVAGANRKRRSTNASRISADVNNTTTTFSMQHRHRLSDAGEGRQKQLQMSTTNVASTTFSTNPKGIVHVPNRAVRSPGGESVSISESITSGQDSTNGMPNFDWYNRSGLPKGIENIRYHIENVDNVPLLVPLFTDCKQSSTQEMIKIMQENGEVVCTIGSSANQWNASIFGQSDTAVAIEPLHAVHCAVRAFMLSTSAGGAGPPTFAAGDAADEDSKRRQYSRGFSMTRYRLSVTRWSRSHEIPLFVRQRGGMKSAGSSSLMLMGGAGGAGGSANNTPEHRPGADKSNNNLILPATRTARQRRQPAVDSSSSRALILKTGSAANIVGSSSNILGGGGGGKREFGGLRRKSQSGSNLLALAKNAAATAGSRRSSAAAPFSTFSSTTTTQHPSSSSRRVSLVHGSLAAKPSDIRSPFRSKSVATTTASRHQNAAARHQNLQALQRKHAGAASSSFAASSSRYGAQARMLVKRKLHALHIPSSSAAAAIGSGGGAGGGRRHQYQYQGLKSQRQQQQQPTTTTKHNNDMMMMSRESRSSPQDIANLINSFNCALKLHADEPFCLITLIMQSRHFMSVLRNCLLYMASCQLMLFILMLVSRLTLMPYALSLGQLMCMMFGIIPLLCVAIMASPQERQQMKYPTAKNSNLLQWPMVRRYLAVFARFWLPSLIVCYLLFMLSCLLHCHVDADISSYDAAVNGTNNNNSVNSDHFTVSKFASCYPRLANIQNAEVVVSAAQWIVYYELCSCLIVLSASYLNPYHTIFGRNPLRNRWWLLCSSVAIVVSVVYVLCDQGLYMLRTSHDGLGVVWSDAWNEQVSLESDKKLTLAVHIFIWTLAVVWPFILLAVNEAFKRADLVRHEKRQKRARLQFNTKLGQYSPV